MFHFYSTPIIKETRSKIVTQIPGIDRIVFTAIRTRNGHISA